MPQYLVPVQDSVINDHGEWEQSSGDITYPYDYNIPVGDEHDSPSSVYDADSIWARFYWSSGTIMPFIWTQRPVKFRLALYGDDDPFDPHRHRDHILRVRIMRQWDTDVGGPDAFNLGLCGLAFTLLQGPDPIFAKTWRLDSADSSFADFSIELPSTVVSQGIDDYSDLWIQVSPTYTHGSFTPSFDVKMFISHIELEIPSPTDHVNVSGIAPPAMSNGHRVFTGINVTGLDGPGDDPFGLVAVFPPGAIRSGGEDFSGSLGNPFVTDSDQSIHPNGISWPRLRSVHRVYSFPNSEPIELTLRAQAIGDKTLRVRRDPVLFNTFVE